MYLEAYPYGSRSWVALLVTSDACSTHGHGIRKEAHAYGSVGLGLGRCHTVDPECGWWGVVSPYFTRVQSPVAQPFCYVDPLVPPPPPRTRSLVLVFVSLPYLV